MVSDTKNDERKFVLLIDILSYKELIKRKSIDELFQQIAPLFTMLSDSANRIVGIDSYIYQDTIVFIPRPNTENALADLIEIAQAALLWSQRFALLGAEYIPIRGAIGYGEIRTAGPTVTFQFSHSDTILRAENVQMLMGRGLLDAYEAEQRLELMGVIISDAAVDAAGLIVEGNAVRSGLILYDCPLKTGKESVEKTKKLLVRQFERSTVERIIKQMERIASSHEGCIRNKYQNTIDFLRYTEQRWYMALESLRQQRNLGETVSKMNMD